MKHVLMGTGVLLIALSACQPGWLKGEESSRKSSPRISDQIAAERRRVFARGWQGTVHLTCHPGGHSCLQVFQGRDFALRNGRLQLRDELP